MADIVPTGCIRYLSVNWPVDISAIDVLVDILPEKAGSLFSLNSLREDLNVTHKTISSWVDILEKFYYHFRIYPFQSTLIKSLRKEPKLYLWDWSEIKDEGIDFMKDGIRVISASKFLTSLI